MSISRLVVILVILGGAAYVVKLAEFRNTQVDAALLQATSQVSRSLPRMLNSQMRFDRVVAQPGKVVVYHVTLVDLRNHQPQAEKLAQAVKPKLIEMYRSDENLKYFRLTGVTVKFRLYDWWGTFLAEFASDHRISEP